jgi:hypothetical protein
MSTSAFSAAVKGVVVAGLVALSAAAVAGTVVLKDGTIISGEVESLQDGVYTINTASLGRVRVPKDQVRSIDADQGPAAPAARSPADGSAPGAFDPEAAKQRIAADPALMTLLLSLQNDADMRSVVQDPEVMKAIAAGDYTALMKNPKIIALMSNPKVRELVDAVR